MHRIALLLTVLAACSDDGGPTDPAGGPELGYWTVDTEDLFGEWSCLSPIDDEACEPPPPFLPPPTEVRIGGGGVVDWGVIEHDGAAGEPNDNCILVPAEREHAHERAEYTVCNITDGEGVPQPGRAGAFLRWDVGTAAECWCSAHFLFVGPE